MERGRCSAGAYGAAKDYVAILPGATWLLGCDLHGGEVAWVCGAPHPHRGAAAPADSESAGGYQVRVARTVTGSDVPAFVEAIRADVSETPYGQLDGPSGLCMVGVCLA